MPFLLFDYSRNTKLFQACRRAANEAAFFCDCGFPENKGFRLAAEIKDRVLSTKGRFMSILSIESSGPDFTPVDIGSDTDSRGMIPGAFSSTPLP